MYACHAYVLGRSVALISVWARWPSGEVRRVSLRAALFSVPVFWEPYSGRPLAGMGIQPTPSGAVEEVGAREERREGGVAGARCSEAVRGQTTSRLDGASASRSRVQRHVAPRERARGK